MNAQAHNLSTLPQLPSQPALAPMQGVAVVSREAPEGGWWLRLGERELLGQRAASCLLAPAVGDQVWMAGDGEHGVFVLAVLTRASAGPTSLEVDGDLELRARGGQVRLRSDQGLELSTSGRVSVSAAAVEVQAREASFTFAKIRAVAREVFASFSRVTRVGQILELLVDTVRQRSNNSYRAIAGIDHTQAETIHYRATGDAHIEADHALINGKDLVKMDGGQIHLG